MTGKRCTAVGHLKKSSSKSNHLRFPKSYLSSSLEEQGSRRPRSDSPISSSLPSSRTAVGNQRLTEVQMSQPKMSPALNQQDGIVPGFTTHYPDRTASPDEAIAKRAYEKFTARGYVHGLDREDWDSASRELADETQTVSGRR